MREPPGGMLAQVLEPADRIRDRGDVLRSGDRAVVHGDVHPLADELLRIALAHGLGPLVGHPDRTVQVRNTPALPLSHPVHPEHTPAPQAHRVGLAELHPGRMIGRTLPDGEGDGEPPAIKPGLQDGIQELGVGADRLERPAPDVRTQVAQVVILPRGDPPSVPVVIHCDRWHDASEDAQPRPRRTTILAGVFSFWRWQLDLAWRYVTTNQGPTADRAPNADQFLDW